MSKNPLLNSFEFAPFDKIKNEYFVPAIIQLINNEKDRINKIIENPDAPSFENVIDEMENTDDQLDKVLSIFFNLSSAHTNDELQTMAEEILPLISEFGNWILQNEDLFNKINQVYHLDNQNLTPEQTFLLSKTFKNFQRNGALLDEVGKAKLSKISTELGLKQHHFGKNVLAATNNYTKHITDENLLDGIPENSKHQFRNEAKALNLDGFIINLQQPSITAVLKYANNRDLRKEIATINATKCSSKNQFDNQEIVKEIIQLRQDLAQLLGFETYADYVLEERMAGNVSRVLELLNGLSDKAKVFAEKDIEELKSLAKKDGIDEVFSYDHAFYAEKLKQIKLDFSEEEIKSYFSLDKVLDAVFELSNTLFNLNFEECFNIPIYHPEVRTFQVRENNELKAILYLDFFPRKSKQSGAWMTSYRNQSIKNNTNIRPHISVVCNFSKSVDEIPSLLNFNEVTTLFHEFGHALHGILANTQYSSLSGTSVLRDFVELPSQFLENYCYEVDFLQSFAKHYQTNETLAQEKIIKISEYKKFMEAYQCMRQVGFGLLDIAFHTQNEPIKDVIDFENQCLKSTQLYPITENASQSCSFSHIFQGGYAVGYYSYKWAEVLDADAFAYFKENGIFNPSIADKFKKLLSLGGTKNPMDLYMEFRGEKPNIHHLLERSF